MFPCVIITSQEYFNTNTESRKVKRVNLGKRVGTNIYNTGIVSRALSSQTFKEKGFEITPEQYLILDLIIENGELYQRQISEITLKDRANVARIIKILLEKELIERISEAKGRRVYKIVITEKGRILRDKIFPTVIEIRKNIAKGIPEEELIITLNTLKKIYENVRDKVKLQI